MVGKGKIDEICDILRKQTLEPAKKQAQEIIENARIEANNIIEDANNEKKKIVEEAVKEGDKKKDQILSALKLASQQVIDKLKNAIEEKFFKKGLKELIIKETSNPKIIVDLINCIIQAIEKEGIESDLSVYIPKHIGTDKINAFLTKDILDKLREKKVMEEPFLGGIKVKIHEEQLTIDITDQAIFDLIAEYIREDFREMIFN
ncbi:MAG: hypothetical protein AMS24_03350 [Chlamydiae bacterium SM23_39]|nr:MAG: hypothetical protein AMS24_03350 [Chlamydiae bacterium SM23_39]